MVTPDEIRIFGEVFNIWGKGWHIQTKLTVVKPKKKKFRTRERNNFNPLMVNKVQI